MNCVHFQLAMLAYNLFQMNRCEVPRVACLSGTSFGEFGEGYIRFSYANLLENVMEAVRRIESVADKWKAALADANCLTEWRPGAVVHCVATIGGGCFIVARESLSIPLPGHFGAQGGPL